MNDHCCSELHQPFQHPQMPSRWCPVYPSNHVATAPWILWVMYVIPRPPPHPLAPFTHLRPINTPSHIPSHPLIPSHPPPLPPPITLSSLPFLTPPPPPPPPSPLPTGPMALITSWASFPFALDLTGGATGSGIDSQVQYKG